MVSISEAVRFHVDYSKGEFPNLRYGQAFYNKHVHTGIPDPELFYCKEEGKAHKMIWEKYVDLSIR